MMMRGVERSGRMDLSGVRRSRGVESEETALTHLHRLERGAPAPRYGDQDG
jgi:hypothetical protein